MPKNVVVVLLDSLNRHLLGAYGSDEFETPNLDRFAARSVRFDRHFVGSLPCMPARHDTSVRAVALPIRRDGRGCGAGLRGEEPDDRVIRQRDRRPVDGPARLGQTEPERTVDGMPRP